MHFRSSRRLPIAAARSDRTRANSNLVRYGVVLNVLCVSDMLVTVSVCGASVGDCDCSGCDVDGEEGMGRNGGKNKSNLILPRKQN